MADPFLVELLESGVTEWNRWRGKHWLGLPDLGGADLSWFDLKSADLQFAQLSGAKLIGAVLSRADFSGANLSAADCSRSNLSMANLSGANLSAADCSRSNLSRANLSEADLTKANLSEATLNQTVFGATNLTSTEGLDTCTHRGPSTLDHRALAKSGPLPRQFLRGCGIPELLIDYLPSILNQAIPFYSCFISYSHVDKAFARRLHDSLQSRGIRCWLDEKEVLPGDDIYEQAAQGIRLWDKVLLCCSEDSLTSLWVDTEIESAFQKERALMKERKIKVQTLIPLDLDGYLLDGWVNGKPHGSGAILRRTSRVGRRATANAKSKSSGSSVHSARTNTPAKSPRSRSYSNRSIGRRDDFLPA